MNRAVHTGIVLAVSMHMVFGCYLHHAHGHPLTSGHESVCETTCPHHHGQNGPSRDPCDQRPGDRGCGHDRCVFTRVESDGAPQFAAGEHGLPALGFVPCQPTLSGVEAVDLALRNCGEPVRLYLMNQALLL